MPSTISASSRASVPLAQQMQCLAPQNAASCRSSSPTSGPRTNRPCFKHGGDRRLDAVAEMLALCREVDKGRNRLAYGLCSCDLHRAPLTQSTRQRGPIGIERGRVPASIVLHLGSSLRLPVGPAADYHSMIEVSNPPATGRE